MLRSDAACRATPAHDAAECRASVIWQRTVETKIVRSDIDPDVAVDVLFGPIIFRLIVGYPLIPQAAATFAETALKGMSITPSTSPKAAAT